MKIDEKGANRKGWRTSAEVATTYPAEPKPVKGFVAMNEAGTQRIGEEHAGAKLTDAEVEEIRTRWEAGDDGSAPNALASVLRETS